MCSPADRNLPGMSGQDRCGAPHYHDCCLVYGVVRAVLIFILNSLVKSLIESRCLMTYSSANAGTNLQREISQLRMQKPGKAGKCISGHATAAAPRRGAFPPSGEMINSGQGRNRSVKSLIRGSSRSAFSLITGPSRMTSAGSYATMMSESPLAQILPSSSTKAEARGLPCCADWKMVRAELAQSEMEYP